MNFYKELSEYLGKDEQIVTEYCKIAPIVLAYKWQDEKEDPIKYYKESEDYICDLSMYQTMLQNNGFHEWLKKTLKDFNVKTFLDFGGGIGEYSIIASKLGTKTDYLEIEGSKTREYAEYRFKNHNVSPSILGIEDEYGKYDMICAMDVAEHLLDSERFFKDISKKCTYLICNEPKEIPYNWVYPQHISKIDCIYKYFDQIAGRLWKSKIYEI
ncbi:MAG: methyltransferase domain-containing protein [Clostridia bacterium]|nr:methyltransferase domain-containing protein [Clostridia bacterium]